MRSDPIDLEKPVYSIGTAARLLGVSVQTLRLYEQHGLIVLYKAETSHRRFSESDLDRIKCIRRVINEDKYSIPAILRMLSFLPCWSIRNCSPESRQQCAAFGSHTGPCWSVKQRPDPCQQNECRVCPVYAKFADCNSLKATIVQLTAASTMPLE